jgi:hypothetical protein
MKLRAMAMMAAVVMGQPLLTETASAATLWRGIVVVTSLGAAPSPACAAEYSVGESFEILYRPNLGAPVDEAAQVIGPSGSFLITSTDAANRTLRAGSVSVVGASYAQGFAFVNPNNPVTITPAVITAATVGIRMTGTVRNAGLPNCNVTFRASLLPIGHP